MIRKMWDVGLAHRDIKPANLMVQRGELKLIDVFFVQVRPSPWRQAVDLGNMMLVLALRSDAQTVYEAALRYFTPDDLAEAFAATRGVASPTQLRQHLKEDGRDLLAQFRAMAPADLGAALERPPGRADHRLPRRAFPRDVDQLRAVLPHPRHGDDAELRHRGGDAADGAGGADRHQASLRLGPALRLERRNRRDHPGKGELRRSGSAADGP